MRRAWIYDVDDNGSPWAFLGWLQDILDSNEYNHGLQLRIEGNSVVLEEVKV
jgi:hypothetical protein